MRSGFPLFLLFDLALLTSAAAQGQNVCPKDQYQALPLGMSGPGRCVPIPRNLRGEALQPPSAATHWGAIAVDETSGKFSSARDLPTKRVATETALTECNRDGGARCVVMATYGNGCGVIVMGDKTRHQGFADVSADHAKQTAMATCKKDGNQSCTVVYSECSLGK